MKKITIYALVFSLFSTLALTNCTAGGDSKSELPTAAATASVPSKISISVPDSLKKNSTGGYSFQGYNNENYEYEFANATAGTDTSYGYEQVKSITFMMKDNSGLVSLNLILLGAVESKVKANAGNCTDNLEVTFTDELKAKIKSAMLDTGTTEAEWANFETQLNQVAQNNNNKIPAPTMTYTANVGGYENQVYMYSGSDPSSTPTCDSLPSDKEIVQWTGTKRIKYSSSFSDGTMAGTMLYTYDGNTKSSTFSMVFYDSSQDDLKTSQRMTMQECSLTKNEDNCVKIKASLKFDASPTATGKDTKELISLTAKADDNGGYLYSIRDWNDDTSNTTSVKITEKDYFTGTGSSVAYVKDGTVVSGTVPTDSTYDKNTVISGIPVPSITGVTYTKGNEYVITKNTFDPASPEQIHYLGSFVPTSDTETGEIMYWGHCTDVTGGTAKLYQITAYDATSGMPKTFTEVASPTLGCSTPISSGSLVTSFNESGMRVINTIRPDALKQLVLTSGGKIYAVGSVNYTLAVVAINNSDGSLDSSNSSTFRGYCSYPFIGNKPECENRGYTWYDGILTIGSAKSANTPGQAEVVPEQIGMTDNGDFVIVGGGNPYERRNYTYVYNSSWSSTPIFSEPNITFHAPYSKSLIVDGNDFYVVYNPVDNYYGIRAYTRNGSSYQLNSNFATGGVFSSEARTSCGRPQRTYYDSSAKKIYSTSYSSDAYFYGGCVTDISNASSPDMSNGIVHLNYGSVGSEQFGNYGYGVTKLDSDSVVYAGMSKPDNTKLQLTIYNTNTHELETDRDTKDGKQTGIIQVDLGFSTARVYVWHAFKDAEGKLVLVGSGGTASHNDTGFIARFVDNTTSIDLDTTFNGSGIMKIDGVGGASAGRDMDIVTYGIDDGNGNYLLTGESQINSNWAGWVAKVKK